MSYTIEHRPEHPYNDQRRYHGRICADAWFVRRDGKRVTVALPSRANAESARAVLVADDQRLYRAEQRERKAALRAVM